MSADLIAFWAIAAVSVMAAPVVIVFAPTGIVSTELPAGIVVVLFPAVIVSTTLPAT